jgi:oxygen-independent coproporphyrinogen-3 oxidase
MRGLYVHIPFCSIKCFYCDFAAFAGKRKLVDRYLAAVEKEAGPLISASTGSARTEGTIYIGGGTPSELSAEQISRLFSFLPKSFAEATFESNPESLDLEKLKALKAAGVTRLSLGLQATQDRLLKAIGRKHTWADFLRVFELAREEGFDNLNVDLMFGLPGQSLEDLEQSVADVVALGSEHVSAYGLQIEDQTLFSKRGVRPDEELTRRMHERLIDALAAAGFEHYEISNFAKPGRQSVHNKIYWSNGEYLGLGVSAASHVGGRRWSNLERLDAYIEAVEAGRSAADGEERLEGKAKLGEAVFVGLRLIGGFEPDAETMDAFAADWTDLERRGLIVREGRRVRLSREGVFIANRVFERFVAPFN